PQVSVGGFVRYSREGAHLPGAPDVGGGDGARQYALAWWAAVPNLRLAITDLIAVVDRVGLCYRFGGTHQGELQGIAPTGTVVSEHTVAHHIANIYRSIDARGGIHAPPRRCVD